MTWPRILCESCHGRGTVKDVKNNREVVVGCLTCEGSGSRLLTTADLEGLGEKDWVCDYNSKVTSLPVAICRAGSDLHRACGWRLLIPIPADEKPPPKITDYDYETEGLGGT